MQKTICEQDKFFESRDWSMKEMHFLNPETKQSVPEGKSKRVKHSRQHSQLRVPSLERNTATLSFNEEFFAPFLVVNHLSCLLLCSKPTQRSRCLLAQTLLSKNPVLAAENLKKEKANTFFGTFWFIRSLNSSKNRKLKKILKTYKII